MNEGTAKRIRDFAKSSDFKLYEICDAISLLLSEKDISDRILEKAKEVKTVSVTELSSSLKGISSESRKKLMSMSPSELEKLLSKVEGL